MTFGWLLLGLAAWIGGAFAFSQDLRDSVRHALLVRRIRRCLAPVASSTGARLVVQRGEYTTWMDYKAVDGSALRLEVQPNGFNIIGFDGSALLRLRQAAETLRDRC